MEYCKYGCGQEAKYALKSSNGELVCCSESFNQCPVNKKKNSEKRKIAHKEGRCKSFGGLSFVIKRNRKEKILVPGNCELCGKEHDGSYGSGRFCSCKCARSFSSFEKREEINEKVSNTLKGKTQIRKIRLTVCVICKKEFETKSSYAKYCKSCNPKPKKICPTCKKEFQTKSKDQECCSKICSLRSPIRRKATSDRIKRKIAAGEWHWQRDINNPSYAEQFFITVLTNNNISFKREHKVGKYFIDFVIYDNFALEIDGCQHLTNKIKKSDNKKDKFLKDNGFVVYRIAWKNINKEENKKYMFNEIDKLLLVLNKNYKPCIPFDRL